MELAITFFLQSQNVGIFNGLNARISRIQQNAAAREFSCTFSGKEISALRFRLSFNDTLLSH